jgi:TonB family protein
MGSPCLGEDAPKVAGKDVPAPKRTKTVKPEYPARAQAEGTRGIVILELVIDTEGHVASAEIVRGIPGLDEAALAAVRQWQYQVTKVGGVPVSVKLTVPITFAMKMPEMERAEGIPELRQGATPAYPPDARDQATTVVADVSLDTEGSVAEALVTRGESPFVDAVLSALKTWRFVVDDPDTRLVFRLEAQFIPASSSRAAQVNLRLSDPRQGGGAGGEGPPASPAQVPAAGGPPTAAPAATPLARAGPGEPSESEPATEPSGPEAAMAAAEPSEGAGPEQPEPPAEARGGEAQASPGAKAPEPGAAPPAAASRPEPMRPADADSAPSPPETPRQPAVETLSAPPPPAPPEPQENGVSAIRDVVLADGVPDLVKGRRPVTPPLARMSGASGTVKVRFAVDAAGVTFVSAAEGPELLVPAAKSVVASWSFRRSSARRLRLQAVFTFETDQAVASVTPESADPAS